MRRWSVVVRGCALAGLPVSLAAGLVILLDVSVRGHGEALEEDTARPAAVYRSTPEERRWWSAEFARRWAEVDELPLDVRFDDPVRARTNPILDVLERVNPSIRRVFHQRGGSLSLYDGRVTDTPEMRHLRNVSRPFYVTGPIHYDDVVGLYCPRSHTAFVQCDRPLSRSRHTLLHELGHMLDDMLGEPSESLSFEHATRCDDRLADLGYPEHIADPLVKQSEYFADSFAHLHESAGKRRWMFRDRPAVSRWFQDFLMERIELSHAALESRLDAELRHRIRKRVDAESGVRSRRRVRAVVSASR